jgi:hypothetical protein
MLDLSPREKLVFAPLVLLVLWMGIYPEPFLAPIRPTVYAMVERVAAVQKQARDHRAPANVIPAAAGIQEPGKGILQQIGGRMPSTPAFAGATISD